MKKSWMEALQAAVKRGRFTQAAMNAASDWRTCAVGEAHAKAPRFVVTVSNGTCAPEDETLENLGFRFTEHVSGQRVGQAVETYHRIKARVSELRDAKRAAQQAVTA